MNKKLAAYLTERGLTVDKNRAYGVFNGFETNVEYRVFDNVTPLYLHFSCYTTDEQKRTVQQELNAAAVKYLKFAFSPYGLELGLNDLTLGKLLKRLDEILNKVCASLKDNGALGVGYCPVCGNALNFDQSKKCTVNGITVSIDNDCVDNINTLISAENKDFEEAPNNYLRGFLGAFIGGLVGVGVAVGFYAAGFISAISAFVAIFLGEFLYRKLGGKPNKMMVVILSVTTFVMMMLAVVAIYLVAAAIGAEKVGMDTFAYFKLCMQDEEISAAFTRELILTALFSALGCGYEIFMLLKRIKRKSNI
ncbi:MAG: hypothetical protein NC132_05395 [Corallococcus sp.]|nr:hypothetical protein [Corallococcus sp.]MCM1359972.1 hypothetical protein [Corallococcus sp.]MCM1395529.1 hypothetical protein [Corallococcus sp.]